MTKRKMNQLLVGDTLYDLTEAYRAGARACRAETPFWSNPHRDGSQRHADWAAGHDNEAAGLHRVSVTIDAIEAAPAGLEFVSPEEEGLPPEPATPPYRVFTRAHDEEVRATELLSVDPDLKVRLREAQDGARPDTGALWSEEERGAAIRTLDTLRTGLAERDLARPLILLLDNSGSMRGKPIFALTALIGEIGDALDQAGVSFEVLGFTTRSWKGGRSREDWIMAGRPSQPGRLNDLRHVIYRSAEEPWDRGPLSLMLSPGFPKENLDGEALLWAAERGRALGGATIVQVSDGKPMDDSTLSVNPADYLDRHLEAVDWSRPSSRPGSRPRRPGSHGSPKCSPWRSFRRFLS
jgi:uncharacterized protein with von Willebrand factor type A (vWA) domain